MNSKFHIEKVKLENENMFIVYTMNYIDFASYLPEISSSLIKDNFQGSVFFDLLLNNGRNKRFFRAKFNGQTFEINTFKEINSPSQKLLNTSANFYINHLQLIESSHFSKMQRFIIKKEIESLANSK